MSTTEELAKHVDGILNSILESDPSIRNFHVLILEEEDPHELKICLPRGCKDSVREVTCALVDFAEDEDCKSFTWSKVLKVTELFRSTEQDVICIIHKDFLTISAIRLTAKGSPKFPDREISLFKLGSCS